MSEKGIRRSRRSGPLKLAPNRVMKWDVGHVLVFLLILLSYVYQYYRNEFDIFLRIVVLSITVGIVTAVIWRFTATHTVDAFKSVFDVLIGKNDTLCRIRSPQSEPGSLLDHLFMAIEWSFFPTLMVFFVLSFIAQGMADEGEAVVENNLIFGFMFFIPPALTFISIPIRLISDSSLMRYNIQRRILEPFGDTFKRMFRAVGGVGALASFAKVALSKGGVENAAMDTFTILLYVFPTMFIASVIYGVWHPRYLEQVEAKIETFHYSQYRYLRDAEGVIRLIPVGYPTGETVTGHHGSSIPVEGPGSGAWATGNDYSGIGPTGAGILRGRATSSYGSDPMDAERNDASDGYDDEDGDAHGNDAGDGYDDENIDPYGGEGERNDAGHYQADDPDREEDEPFARPLMPVSYGGGRKR